MIAKNTKAMSTGTNVMSRTNWVGHLPHSRKRVVKESAKQLMLIIANLDAHLHDVSTYFSLMSEIILIDERSLTIYHGG